MSVDAATTRAAMSAQQDPAEGAGEQPGGQPLVASDLFLGLSGILLVVFALLSLPVRDLVLSAEARRAAPDATAAAAALAARENRHLLLARGGDVILMTPGQPATTLRLADLPDDARLADWAAQATFSQAPPLFLAAADSVDAAFLAEAGLAAAGLSRIEMVRLAAGCDRIVRIDGGLACRLAP